MTVRCPREIEIHAYYDRELDAVRSLEIEQHLERCTECSHLMRDLEATHTALDPLRKVTAPPELADRVGRALAREARLGPYGPRRAGKHPGYLAWLRQPHVAAALGALCGVALTLALAASFLRGMGGGGTRIAEELLADHLRSLQPSHLIDVESSDRHTVKPWFAGHADVSPTVADFTQQGYALLGGRMDYVDRRRAAVVVYQHGPHIINVFTWPAGNRPMPHEAMLDGYRMLCWRQADLEYCAVSDTGSEELGRLEGLIGGR